MTFALKFHDTELFHSCSPLYICDWKTVKTESVSDDVLGTLRPREGVTWCCADRRTRRQLKARSRYFGNSSDRNSWGAGTRCRQTITASHRLLNYSGLPVVSSQEVKKPVLFCVVYYTTLAVSQTTWHWMVRFGMRRSWQNGVLEGLMKTGIADDRTKIRTRYMPHTGWSFFLIPLWGIFFARRVYGEDSVPSVPFLLTVTHRVWSHKWINLLYSFYQARPYLYCAVEEPKL